MVISRIRKHRPHLTQLGIKSLALFGSVARGEAKPESDVDILVEFEGRATFDRFMDTKYYRFFGNLRGKTPHFGV